MMGLTSPLQLPFSEFGDDGGHEIERDGQPVCDPRVNHLKASDASAMLVVISKRYPRPNVAALYSLCQLLEIFVGDVQRVDRLKDDREVVISLGHRRTVKFGHTLDSTNAPPS